MGHFTKNQIEEIKQALVGSGIQDKDIQQTSVVSENDKIVITKPNGENKIATVQSILSGGTDSSSFVYFDATIDGESGEVIDYEPDIVSQCYEAIENKKIPVLALNDEGSMVYMLPSLMEEDQDCITFSASILDNTKEVVTFGLSSASAHLVSLATQAQVNAKYTKPSDGIPSTDLSPSVQTSLGKADTALQEHQDISGKVDKIEGKGLSTNDYTNADKAKLDGIPSDICPDVPADAPSPLYGRTPTHEWQPIALVTSLSITLWDNTSGTDVVPTNPNQYEIILSFGDGTVRRAIQYEPDLNNVMVLTDIPVGVRMTLNVKPPVGSNQTAPRSKMWNTQIGVPLSYVGYTKQIVDGIYILDKFGDYTPWGIWATEDNESAIGVGYKSSSLSFTFNAKKLASALHPSDGCPFASPESLCFGGYGVDLQGLGFVVGIYPNVAVPNGLANNAKMLEMHAVGQSDWRTADTISAGDKGEHFFQTAAAAARYVGVEGDVIGTWMLSDIRILDQIRTNRDIISAFSKITGDTHSWSSQQILSCLPTGGISQFWQSNNSAENRNVNLNKLALLIRNF